MLYWNLEKPRCFSNLTNIGVFVKVFLYIYASSLAVIKHASLFVKVLA